MELTLYQNAFCPYSERVRRVLGEMALVHRRIEVGWHELDSVHRLTGIREIPVLLHDGHAKAGSSAIARYLNGFNPERHLFPASADDELGHWETEADRMLDVFMRLALPVWADEIETFKEREAFRAHYARFGEYTELRQHTLREWQATQNEWSKLNAVLAKQPYLLGEALTYADLAMYGSVYAVAQFKGYYVPDSQHHLASWYERIRTAGQYRDQELFLGSIRAKHAHKDNLYAETRYQDPGTDTRQSDDY